MFIVINLFDDITENVDMFRMITYTCICVTKYIHNAKMQ